MCCAQLLSPASLLCPWDSPDKDNEVGCHALLQGIFPTQELNAKQVDSLPSDPPGNTFPEDLPDPEIEPVSPALQADSLTAELPGKKYIHKR